MAKKKSAAKKKPAAKKSFEQTLWDTADKLRGTVESSEYKHVERELLLIKVRTVGTDAREEVKRTSDIYRGQIVDITQNLYTIQLTGAGSKLDAFVATMDECSEIIEVVRSGVCGIARGDKSLRA